MKAIFCCLFAVLLCGCSVIHSQEPVGLTPKDLSKEIDDWEGCWSCDDETFNVFVMDATNGFIRVMGFEREDDKIEKKSLDIYIREAGGWSFASMKDEEDDEVYVWGRAKMEDGVFVAWAPDCEKFTQLIAEGTLPGTTNGSDGVLGSLSTNHYDIITDSDSVLFEWDEPIIFWKISK
jgi:hypothetical protein